MSPGDVIAMRAQLARTEKLLALAVRSGNMRAAQQHSGEAVRLEEALAAAGSGAGAALAEGGAGAAARNIVGRVHVNDANTEEDK